MKTTYLLGMAVSIVLLGGCGGKADSDSGTPNEGTMLTGGTGSRAGAGGSGASSSVSLAGGAGGTESTPGIGLSGRDVVGRCLKKLNNTCAEYWSEGTTTEEEARDICALFEDDTWIEEMWLPLGACPTEQVLSRCDSESQAISFFEYDIGSHVTPRSYDREEYKARCSEGTFTWLYEAPD